MTLGMRLAPVALVAVLVPVPASGQPANPRPHTYRLSFDFYSRGPYRDGVPRPEDVLGYRLGTLHTPHLRMERVFEALARVVPQRIKLEPYGESVEKQPLFLAVITSEENHARLDEIRRNNLRLTETASTDPAEAARVAATNPIIVWLDYSNDGNETAALEAAMQVAYQLVAGESEEARRFRDQAVIIVEPDHNPESHDRHVYWYNAFGVGDEDPGAMEHHAPWGMSTNNNHYQIDLNRDVWALTQQENQAIAVQVLRWRPQVFVDHHGQTENYFFAPPVRPLNPSLPESHRRWLEVFGQGNARAFDEHGWQYFARDVFDLFYAGYWDSWPALHGAIGMTYETDGGGSKGLAWRRQDGSVVTFEDGIAHHFTASLATVRTAVENREAILRDFHAFFRDALDAGRRGIPFRAVVLQPQPDPRRAAVLVATLLRHGVQVRRVARPFRAEARHLESGRTELRDFPAGAYLVDMAQPDKRVAETFLALEAPLDSGFVREQFARWSRNARRGEAQRKEGYEFYDITAWSLPVAFGVEAYTLARLPEVASEPVVAAGDRIVGTGDWADEIPFAIPGLEGGVRGGPARSAYAFLPFAEGALRLVARLLHENFKVAVSTVPLMIGSREFSRGTFVVRVDRNPEAIHQRLDELAQEASVEVHAFDTSFPERGQAGPGSNPVLGLKKPTIAMVADEGIRVTSYGAAWFTLDRRLAYPFTPIRLTQLGQTDLSAFDVIALGEGSADAFRSGLGEDGVERLRRWVRDGGTLVGWGGGTARFAIRSELTTTSLAGEDESAPDSAEVRVRRVAIDSVAQVDAPRPPLPAPTARPDAIQPVPGSNFRAALDLSHWLSLGYASPTLTVLVQGDDFLTLSRKGASPVVFPEEGTLHVSGFVWPGNTERMLAGTAYAVVEPQGRGQVILFSNDPNYRLVWRSTARLFANALLLGPTLGASGFGRP
ncbi:MAG: hypothetical protein HY704_10420 [Gemmatimonadetes bacterium]|nr:hypothetical protein [Gemmatimonadota bacterium]